jgi:hypothetical protein
MILSDSFFVWPYGEDLEPAISDITPILENSVLSHWIGANGSGDLAEFIALLCRTYQVSPWWVILSGQREQSIFTRPDLPINVSDAWLGYVGQDVGRATLPAYYGLYAQVVRMVSQTAWYMAMLQTTSFPDWRLRDQSLRFIKGTSIKTENNGEWNPRQVNTLSEWVQLQYTPHEMVLLTNWQIAQERIPAKFLGA